MKEDNIQKLIALLTYSLQDRGSILFSDITLKLIAQLTEAIKDTQEEEVELCISSEGYFLNTDNNSMLVQSCHAKRLKEYFILNGRPCSIKKEGTERRLLFI
tara:strand:+ start:527 stop:832 length:306 start_codon:yes stop_codon:yes gene_type:complete